MRRLSIVFICAFSLSLFQASGAEPAEQIKPSVEVKDNPAKRIIANTIDKKQQQLRSELMRLKDQYDNLAPEIDAKFPDDRQTDNVKERIEEFISYDRITCDSEIPTPSSIVPSKSNTLMFNPEYRIKLGNGNTSVLPVSAATSFATGPSGECTPHNGELRRAWTDVVFPSRGGIRFEFQRFYSSHKIYDGSLGKSWDHSYNQRIAGVRDTKGELTKLKWLFGDGSITFDNKDGKWVPEDGEFWLLDLQDNNIIIINPEHTKWTFEPLSEQSSILWRLKEIASRHGQYKANQLILDYKDDTGLLTKITDPFGNMFKFDYDADGRMIQLSGPGILKQYEYKDGCLVKVSDGNVNIGMGRTAESATHLSYTLINGYNFLSELRRDGLSHVRRYSYGRDGEKLGKLLSAGDYCENSSTEWKFEYVKDETKIIPPSPQASEILRFSSASGHASLPVERNIPAIGAIWEYKYNSAHQIAQIIFPDKSISAYGYDSKNDSILMRGNILKGSRISNNQGDLLAEYGKKITYLSETSLPDTVEFYEKPRVSVEKIIGKEIFEYSKPDLNLIRHNNFGIVKRQFHNSFGELAVEMDAKGNANITYYSDNYPSKTDYEFTKGSVSGSGLAVRVVEDASPEQIEKALGELNAPKEKLQKDSCPSVALETERSYDEHGNVTHFKRDKEESIACYNRSGRILAKYSSATGRMLFSYDAAGRKIKVLHEYDPKDVNFSGNQNPLLKGCYYIESFAYDDLGRICRWSPTDEPIGKDQKFPEYQYERYPDNTLRKVTDPDGVSRMDEYSAETGQIKSIKVVGKNQSVTLSCDYQYYPGGNLKTYKDQFGGVWEYGYDGFGRTVRTTNPDGVVETISIDGLERTTSRLMQLGKNKMGGAWTEYGIYALPAIERVLRILPDREEMISSAEYRYDGCGQLIADRGIREGSWNVHLYDGLGRKVGTMNSTGDMSANVYSGSLLTATGQSFQAAHGEPRKMASIKIFDPRGYMRLVVPVDGSGTARTERTVLTHFNVNGHQNHIRSIGGITQENRFNTIGKTVSEVFSPSEKDGIGETYNIHYEYLPSGRLSKRIRSNNPLAIFKDGTPQRVAVPQELLVEYDDLGRAIKETAPDGLQVIRNFGDSSLPRQITWKNRSDPEAKNLRALHFEYDKFGRIMSILNQENNIEIRKLEYDRYGNCTSATDFQGNDFVKTIREFDSLSNLLSETISTNNETLPKKQITTDIVHGLRQLRFENLPKNSLSNWSEESRQYDEIGRLEVLKTAGRQAARFNYAGAICLSKELTEASLNFNYGYNTMNEMESLDVIRSSDSTRFGRFNYGYGPQGQMEYGTTSIRKGALEDYTVAQYSQDDAYRRLIAQNSELSIPSDKATAQQRRDEIFNNDAKLASANTGRRAYDEAGNMRMQYQGGKITDETPRDIDKKRQPIFYSPASVILSQPIPPSMMDELASTRRTTKASYTGQDDNLGKKEYHYDFLGNIIEYEGIYWNGNINMPVVWTLKYDPFGRLAFMSAKQKEDFQYQGKNLKKGESCAELKFLYDSSNQRLIKETIDHTGMPTANSITATLYENGNQSIVLGKVTEDGNGIWKLQEQYLWGSGSRELLKAAISRFYAEGDVLGGDEVATYYFIQDRGLNITATLRQNGVNLEILDVASYCGFGQNSTRGKLDEIISGMSESNSHFSIDGILDQETSAKWVSPDEKPQYIMLKTNDTLIMSTLKIWTDKFPKNFTVFVIPPNVPDPVQGNLENWWTERENEGVHPVSVNDGKCEGRMKTGILIDPYEIPLSNMEGNRIVILWEKNQDNVEVREFELTVTPKSPIGIAFAGQWLDRETGLYYQINRYMMPETGNFISPDPLGFAAGDNLYAYANNNPLEWHDPDGRFPHIIAGAIFGAVLGGGTYAVQSWLNDEQWDWGKFGIYTGAGALSGAAAAATGGASLAWTAGAGMTATQSAIIAGTLSGAAGGAVYGGVSGGGITYYETRDLGLSFRSAGKNALISGGLGALGGAVGGAVLSKLGASFIGTTLSGTAGGGAAGGLEGGIRGAIEDGTWSGMLRGAAVGSLKGGVGGAAIGAATWGAGRISGRIKPLPQQPENLPDPRSSPDGKLLVRTRTVGAERKSPGHHIKPLGLGGSDNPTNVIPTPEGHGGSQHPAGVSNDPYGTMYY